MRAAQQQSLAYQSEFRLRDVLAGEARTVHIGGSEIAVPDERKFGDVASVQRYVDTVLRLPNVRRRWPRVKRDVQVIGTKARTKATYSPQETAIYIPTHGADTSISWAMREVLILHEVAHHLEHDGHGPRWLGAFCFLLDDCVAPEAGFMLRVFSSEEGLQIVEPVVQ